MISKPNRVLIRIIAVGAIAGGLAATAHFFIEKAAKAATKT